MPINHVHESPGYREVLAKLQRFCAYQERCHFDVRKKLKELETAPDSWDFIIADLIDQNFLNEERFAKIFSGGKFRIKKWGRLKIEKSLKEKQLTDYCIRKGLEEIDEEQYLETLDHLANRKFEETNAPNIYSKRDKVSKYLINRGFEPNLIWAKLKKLG